MNRASAKRLVSAGRPVVFIGSSSEGRSYAEAVRAHLAPTADAEVWTDEHVFAINRAYFDDLVDGAGYYDYAIAVLTPDDRVTVRDETGPTARDNVVFEFGLFLGRLGVSRAFALREASVRVFSDFAGIEMATFTATGHPESDTREACARIADAIERREGISEGAENPGRDMSPSGDGYLTSTALALGYYHNFLSPLLDNLIEGKTLRVIETDAEGEEVRGVDYDGRAIGLTILLPRALSDLEEKKLNARTRKLQKIELVTTRRPYPLYVRGELTEGAVNLFDVPTTLRAAGLAIRKTFSPGYLSRDPKRYARIQRREIANFEKTLRAAIPDEIEDIVVSFALLGGDG